MFSVYLLSYFGYGFMVGKESTYNPEDPGLIPGLGRSPGEGNGNSAPVSLPGKLHEQRSLAGYSPWGCKESDRTE